MENHPEEDGPVRKLGAATLCNMQQCKNLQGHFFLLSA
ncbi:RHOMBOID-like protein [Psidium guajava]|nr:RHOMBOID-like protein [Psidium guajava]